MSTRMFVLLSLTFWSCRWTARWSATPGLWAWTAAGRGWRRDPRPRRSPGTGSDALSGYRHLFQNLELSPCSFWKRRKTRRTMRTVPVCVHMHMHVYVRGRTYRITELWESISLPWPDFCRLPELPTTAHLRQSEGRGRVSTVGVEMTWNIWVITSSRVLSLPDRWRPCGNQIQRWAVVQGSVPSSGEVADFNKLHAHNPQPLPQSGNYTGHGRKKTWINISLTFIRFIDWFLRMWSTYSLVV